MPNNPDASGLEATLLTSEPSSQRRPAGSEQFDRSVTALCGWIVLGMYVDGWAHNHLPSELETFFTPWHALLYSGLIAFGAFLIAKLFKNCAKGYPWRWALPVGYGLSLLGVAVFFVAGLCDLVWHELLGIEVGVEALLSPPHLGLALGGVLMVTGPLRAVWRRSQPPACRLGAYLPMLLSLTFLLSFLTFFTQFAHPLTVTWVTKDVTNLEVDTELYVMNADGTNQSRLTALPRREDLHPAWSPDGNKIVFASNRDGEPESKSLEIYVMNVDGSNLQRLTQNDWADGFPSWSPDGRQILFTAEQGKNQEIYVMDADGRSLKQLTQDPQDDWMPQWSRKGNLIAFTSKRDGNAEIYVMNPDGSAPTRVTNHAAKDWGATWSPDGKRLAFTSERDGNPEIYIMNADGAELIRLTQNQEDDHLPVWSPDGQRIAFASNRDGSLDIYSMNLEGGDLKNLTQNPGMRDGDWAISWSPDSSQIVFAARGNFPGSPFLRQTVGITSILLQTALLIGVLLLAMRRWRLPFGSWTVILSLNAALMSILDDQYWMIGVAIATGLIADLLYWRLQPSVTRPFVLRLFVATVPMIFYGLYFFVVSQTLALGWSVPLWAGAIAMSGIVGWLLSYLLSPPCIPAQAD